MLGQLFVLLSLIWSVDSRSYFISRIANIWDKGLAYPLNFPMIVIFMFLAGVAGAPALSNIAATISDLFGFRIGAALPMALFVVGGTVGPVLGSLTAYWVLQANIGAKWIFLINTIIGAGMTVLSAFIPETLPPRTPSSMPGSDDSESDQKVNSPSLGQTSNVNLDASAPQTPHPLSAGLVARPNLRFAATIIPQLYLQDVIVLLLGVYNGIANGILLVFITGTVITYLSEKQLRYRVQAPSHLQSCSQQSKQFLPGRQELAIHSHLCCVPLRLYTLPESHLSLVEGKA